MKNSDFVHLHCHTTRSLLDGYTKVPDLVDIVKAHGQIAVTCTEHGSLGSTPELWREAKRVGILPVAGLEAYIAGNMREKGAGIDIGNNERKTPYFHITLISTSLTGYMNLCKLSTLSYTDGYQMKPRVDLEAIEAHADGLILLSGCIGAPAPQLIINGKERAGLEWCMRARDIFGERFFLESQSTGEKEQVVVNKTYLEWTKKHSLKHLVSGDSHYSRKEDSDDHDTLLCLGTRALKDAKERMRFVPNEYFVKSTQEMMALGFPESSLTNTRLVADMCTAYDLPRSAGFPKRENAYEILESSAYEGLLKRLAPPEWLEKDELGHQPTSFGVISAERDEDAYYMRLSEELDVIKSLGYEDYFLLAYDIVSKARENNMWHSWGRGSSVGSLVAYSLGITGLDPVEHQLYFARFLNKDRRNPPDVDIDVTDEDRPHIIKFIEDKYGADCVSHIATCSELGPRQVLMDICRTLGKSQEALKVVMAALPYDPTLGISDILEDAKISKNIAQYLGAEVVDLMRKFTGVPRHMSVHAAGIIIDSEPLSGKLPFMMPRKEGAVRATQYVNDDLEELGYLKLDILGVRALRVLRDTARMAGIDTTRIPMDDKKTYDLLSAGRTIGIFQCGGWGFRKFLTEFRPRNFEDVMMTNALYRPGPMQGEKGLGLIIARRNKKQQIAYQHALLEPVLKNTYGVAVYQEQLLAMVQLLAGWSLAQADILRWAVGKKKLDKMQELKPKFHADCIKMGHTAKFAEEVFETIEFAGRYSWNKAHAAAYGQVTYVASYLKANYMAEYMCCMLNSEEGDQKKCQELIGECSRLGLRVIRAHVNMSNADFEVGCDERGKYIRMGLASVGNLGARGVAAILDARMLLGRFTSVENFRERVPKMLCNATAMRKLTLTKAFAELPPSEELIDVPF